MRRTLVRGARIARQGYVIIVFACLLTVIAVRGWALRCQAAVGLMPVIPFLSTFIALAEHGIRFTAVTDAIPGITLVPEQLIIARMAMINA
jgi:hypothetical protein